MPRAIRDAEQLSGPRHRSRTISVAGERSIDTDWMQEARCAGSDLDFVPAERGIPADKLAPLLAVCAECPVKQECLEYALEQECSTKYGIYGGTTPAERRAL